LAQKRVGLDATEEAVAWLSENGFDQHYGARPLKRLIQQVVVNPASRLVLDGRLKPNDMTRLLVVDGELVVAAEAVQ
jgi:ATP-dependent Clp protease ATP-binding subunit ClpA